MTEDDFFAASPESRPLFDAVLRATARLGPHRTQVSKSQIAFKRKRTFAAVWLPGRYLHREAAPLVLTIFTRQPIPSERWKQVVEPAPGRFTQHLELFRDDGVDAEVEGWLRKAWEEAGCP